MGAALLLQVFGRTLRNGQKTGMEKRRRPWGGGGGGGYEGRGVNIRGSSMSRVYSYSWNGREDDCKYCICILGDVAYVQGESPELGKVFSTSEP